MPSENKTKNLSLNQWAGNEYVKRQDFNDDNKKIDDAIGEVKSHLEENTNKITNINDENILFKQELEKQIQDFTDTKNKPNGIAGLDEYGKLKKEQIPNMFKFENGNWSDLNTLIDNRSSNNKYIKTINIGFEPHIVSIFLEIKAFEKKINDKNRYYSSNYKVLLILDNKTKVIQVHTSYFPEKRDDFQFFNIDKQNLQIQTSIHSFYSDTYSNWCSVDCELNKIFIENNELKFEFNVKESSAFPSNNDVYLNIENLTWSAYKW